MAPEGVAMAYPLGAVERARKVRDVILQALSGKLTWVQAANILGRSPSSVRRLRLKFERGRDHDARGRQPLPARDLHPVFNAEFGRPPADRASAFVPLGRVDLEQILCVEHERVVGRDNVVSAEQLPLQLAKQPGRRACAGLRVLVRRHLDGHHSVWYGTRCFGRYDHRGHPLGRRP